LILVRRLLLALFVGMFFAAPLQALDPPKVKRVGSSDAPSEKLLIGEAEYIGIPGIEAVFNARIDTGATTTSIFAIDIEEFERDGEPWARFVVVNTDKKKEYPLERPVSRVIQIKKRGVDGFTRRLAVAVDLTLGEVTRRVDVNLADRTGFEYPLLIGRNFLRGLAIVDVGKKYTQKTPGSDAGKP